MNESVKFTISPFFINHLSVNVYTKDIMALTQLQFTCKLFCEVYLLIRR